MKEDIVDCELEQQHKAAERDATNRADTSASRKANNPPYARLPALQTPNLQTVESRAADIAVGMRTKSL